MQDVCLVSYIFVAVPSAKTRWGHTPQLPETVCTLPVSFPQRTENGGEIKYEMIQIRRKPMCTADVCCKRLWASYSGSLLWSEKSVTFLLRILLFIQVM